VLQLIYHPKINSSDCFLESISPESSCSLPLTLPDGDVP
ncbi:hypothetical protein CEXT_698821, partial [Caerostris extrusa]